MLGRGLVVVGVLLVVVVVAVWKRSVWWSVFVGRRARRFDVCEEFV